MRRPVIIGLVLSLTSAASPDVSLAADQSPASSSPTRVGPSARDYRDAVEHPDDDDVFARLLSRLPTFEVRQDGALRRYYIWEGDLPLSRTEIRAILYARSTGGTKVAADAELTVHTVGGVEQFWATDNRKLTYAVDRASFGGDERLYRLAVASMRQAAADWVGACTTCRLRIDHVEAQDAAPRPDQVTFVVAFDNKPQSGLIGLAFFPNDPPGKRRLYLFPNYRTTSYDKVGVLRHELGHVLGYRHEQVRGVSGCEGEGNDWRAITPYDSQSAMHYYCGDGGTLTMQLTALDRSGHSKLYGNR